MLSAQFSNTRGRQKAGTGAWRSEHGFTDTLTSYMHSLSKTSSEERSNKLFCMYHPSKDSLYKLQAYEEIVKERPLSSNRFCPLHGSFFYIRVLAVICEMKEAEGEEEERWWWGREEPWLPPQDNPRRLGHERVVAKVKKKLKQHLREEKERDRLRLTKKPERDTQI